MRRLRVHQPAIGRAEGTAARYRSASGAASLVFRALLSKSTGRVLPGLRSAPGTESAASRPEKVGEFSPWNLRFTAARRNIGAKPRCPRTDLFRAGGKRRQFGAMRSVQIPARHLRTMGGGREVGR